MGERNCKECAHYVVKDVKHNYCQNGCGTYDQYIYGCERWDCEFEAKITKQLATEEATAIIKNLKNYLKNEDKVKDKKLHEDVYVALDMAIEAMKGRERIDGN